MRARVAGTRVAKVEAAGQHPLRCVELGDDAVDYVAAGRALRLLRPAAWALMLWRRLGASRLTT
jgi:hypothetical protein